jgi:hypothetical protein
MNIIKSTHKSLITLFIVSLTLVSCGGSGGYVSNVQVSSEIDNSEVLVSLSAELKIGNISLSDVTLPIIVPRTGREIGTVSMYKNMEGKNKFEVELNVSAIANVEAVAARLPNGNVLPLIRDNNVIVIPIQNKANIYLAFSDGVAAIGATVGIRGLDSLGRSVGETSIFPGFSAGQVLGSAGIYTSRTAGQNGFGLFMDISSVIDTSNLLAQPTTSFASLRSSKSSSIASSPKLVLDYNSISTSRSKKRKIDKKLYRLHRNRATL